MNPVSNSRASYFSMLPRDPMDLLMNYLHPAQRHLFSLANEDLKHIAAYKLKLPEDFSTFFLEYKSNELDLLKLTYYAAKINNLGLLKWAHSKGYPGSYAISQEAADNGNLEMLKWAKANGFASHEWYIVNTAAQNGNVEILIWAKENNYPFSSFTCASAAEGGQLKALKWLRENGCSWDERTPACAAALGHLEVLKWTIANGCPWDGTVVALAKAHGRPEILKWAQENGL